MDDNINIVFIDAQDNAPGCSGFRLLEYAKLSSSYYLIERRLDKIGSKLFFIYKGYKTISRILREKNINLIATKDPFTLGLVGYLLKKKFRIGLNVQIQGDIIDNEFFIIECFYNKA